MKNIFILAISVLIITESSSAYCKRHLDWWKTRDSFGAKQNTLSPNPFPVKSDYKDWIEFSHNDKNPIESFIPFGSDWAEIQFLSSHFEDSDDWDIFGDSDWANYMICNSNSDKSPEPEVPSISEKLGTSAVRNILIPLTIFNNGKLKQIKVMNPLMNNSGQMHLLGS